MTLDSTFALARIMSFSSSNSKTASGRCAALLFGLMLATSASPAYGFIYGKWLKGGDSNRLFRVRNDKQVFVKGRSSLRLAAKRATDEQYAFMYNRRLADTYRGKRIRVAAQLRVEGVTGRSILFANVYKQGGKESQRLYGWTAANADLSNDGWQQLEILIEIPEVAEEFAFGFQQWGSGKTWADDFQVDIAPDEVPLDGFYEVYPKGQNPELAVDESAFPKRWQYQGKDSCLKFATPADSEPGRAISWSCDDFTAFLFQDVAAHHYRNQVVSAIAKFGTKPASEQIGIFIDLENTDGKMTSRNPTWAENPDPTACVSIKVPRRGRTIRYGLSFKEHGALTLKSVTLTEGGCIDENP